jgi:gamma-glutamyltranspeptidase/glutathione hydrolase
VTRREVLVPQATVRSAGGLVCSVDPLASSAGAAVLRSGGTAVDAAVAGNAVLAVTAPHMCGMGGDLFALVHSASGPPEVCEAVGWAGAGAGVAADELRAGGHAAMPVQGDVRSVTVPGCVDGWLALHARHGTRPLGELLAPAVAAAVDGFPCSPTLAAMAPTLAGVPGADWLDGARTGRLIRRPGAARALRAIAGSGRDGFYGGEFGAGLLALGRGLFSPADLELPIARWREPIGMRVWDVDLWTAPPPSQGYLAVAGAWIAAGLPLPSGSTGPDEALWAHLLVEAARQAGWDRPDVLHSEVDGSALLAPSRLGPRRAAIDASVSSSSVGPVPAGAGDTTYLCVVDGERRGVSLIQSNASGFGSLAVEPATGINLHGRGLGFSLVPGHPAEYGPGRRPPHTLAPLLATRPGDGSLAAVLGTMGGDAQPQILLQVAARLFAHGQGPGPAVAAGRWWLQSGPGGFDTWTGPAGGQRVVVEGHAPAGWSPGLAERGHPVVLAEAFDHGAGHAHAIVVRDDHVAGAADPRCRTPAAVVA